MTLIENMPQVNRHSTYEAELHVDPKDISFHDVPGDIVRVLVTVHNTGLETSEPTPMRLESAPLGAFVPWRPLARLLVPALEPGESRELSTEVKRPRPAALGDFDRIPPKRLLTALDSADEPSPQPATRFLGLRNLLRKPRTNDRSANDLAGKPLLAPDLWDLLRRGQQHWAGNINVFIGQHPIERHLAQALRIYPGRTNLAMFVVGGPQKPDAYSFELAGVAPDWKAALYDATNNTQLVGRPLGHAIEETRWVESGGNLLVLLAALPPADCEAGNLEVQVTRRSCQTTAVVEFDLDPAAQGAGCYFIA
jgi:hypothetical protein